MHFLHAVSHFVIDLIARYGYAGLFAGMFGQAVGVPLPSELMLGFAGYLAYSHTLSFMLCVLVGTAGDTLGAVAGYYIGYYGGRPLILALGRRFPFAKRDLDAADKWFARFGSRAVLVIKLLPGIRAFGSLPAGVTRMHILVFIGYTALGALIWATLFVSLGFHLGKNWPMIVEHIKPIGISLLAAAVIAIVVWLIVQARADKSRRSDAS